jgi:hypothetical protein
MGLFGSLGGLLGSKAGSALGGLIGGKSGANLGGSIGGLLGETGGDVAGSKMGFKNGGKVTRTGRALVHKGEYVLPKNAKPTKGQRAIVAKNKKRKAKK